MWKHVLLFALLLSGSPVAGSTLWAQVERNPIQDLIDAGRRNLEDLDYRGADSVAGLVLTVPGLGRAHRIQAYQLAAAARYPASRLDQAPSRAMEALRALVQIAPEARLPTTITWAGLDSMLAVARATTFGSAVSLRDSVDIRGVNARVAVEVISTRAAIYRMTIRPLNSASGVALYDSAGPAARAELGFQPVMGEVPRLASGTYRLEITAQDPTTGEVLTHQVRAVLHTPPLPLHRVAAQWDSTGVLPTRTKPARGTSIASGFLVGGFTILAGTVRQPERLAGGRQGNHVAWGIGLGVSTAALSWVLDRGRVIQQNVLFNQALYDKWAAERRRLLDENDAWARAYSGYALFSLEAP